MRLYTLIAFAGPQSLCILYCLSTHNSDTALQYRTCDKINKKNNSPITDPPEKDKAFNYGASLSMRPTEK